MDSKAFKQNVASVTILLIGLLGFGTAVFCAFHWLLKIDADYSVACTIATEVLVIATLFRLLSA